MNTDDYIHKPENQVSMELIEKCEALKREADEKTLYLDSILHSSTVAIAATDLEFRIKYYNPVAEIIFGRAAEEVIGKTVLEMHIKENVDPALFARAVKKVQDEGEYTYVIKRTRTDGAHFYESRIYGMYDKNNSLSGYVFMSHEITERRIAESRLATQYAVTRILAESPNLDDATPRLLEAICTSVGWEIGEIWDVNTIARVLRYNGLWHSPSIDLAEFVEASRNMTFSPGTGLPGRVWASGQPAWISDVTEDNNFPRAKVAEINGLHGAFAFPIRSSDKVIGVMAFFSRSVRPPDKDMLQMFHALGSQIGDFINRKKAEEDLKHYSAELERSNKELEIFASIASHDLQEPLRVISGFAQLLERRYKDKLGTDAKEFISYIVDGVNRMSGLIKDLLDYSRITTRSNAFREVNCNTVLDVALLNLKFSIEESNSVITHGPLPVVTGDEGQLVQLFQNLIGNGIKYRGKEDPLIHISAEPMESSGVVIPQQKGSRGWLFSFRDNGIGIEPRNYERIFQIFQRLHSRNDYPGTGIGLAICKRIVERHGGLLWVESDIGQGSIFYFTIPAFLKDSKA